MTTFDINPQRQLTAREPLTLLRVPLPIDVFQLQTTMGTIFTATDDFQIEALYATNTTTTADYITMHFVPSGGTPDATNMVAYQVAVDAKTIARLFTADNMAMLQPGMTLQALCGVNDAVNLWGHGYNYQGQYST